jgi:hypothetical protein
MYYEYKETIFLDWKSCRENKRGWGIYALLDWPYIPDVNRREINSIYVYISFKYFAFSVILNRIYD